MATPSLQTGAMAPLNGAADVTSRGWPPDAAALQLRYEAYRRHQAREFLSLVPRDALRPLYRAASAPGGESEADAGDPLGLLSSFIERLLPLPPFAVWCEDVLLYPEAHLEEAWMEESVPDRRSPLALDARSETLAGHAWTIELLVYRGGDAWRGHLAFVSDDGRRYRTADVFMDGRLESVRSRFLEFDRSTLEAFLRSVMP